MNTDKIIDFDLCSSVLIRGNDSFVPRADRFSCG